MWEVAQVWHFTRKRLTQALEGLDDAKLNFRLMPHLHTIAEYLYHVAGVEFYWVHHLGGYAPQNEFEACLLRCATDSFLNTAPFPFPRDACTCEGVQNALQFTFERFRPLIENPSAEMLDKPVVSPIGDPIDGREALIRTAQHASYHTGQIWLIRMSQGW